MWVFIKDAFLDISWDAEQCPPGELLIRARKEDDILKSFTKPVVESTPLGEYPYQTILNGTEVANMIACKVLEVDYNDLLISIPITKTGISRFGYYRDVWCSMFHYGRDRG